jgi:TolB-like protein
MWFDRSELRGGDAWDGLIRRQIKGCYLFVPIISANTQSREEGYFRREWKLAVDRTNDMAEDRAFLLPIVIDGTSDSDARVPEKFREVQWTRLPAGTRTDAFVDHVRRLLSPGATTPAATSGRSAALPTASMGAASTRSTSPTSRSFVPWMVSGLLVLVAGYFVVDKFVLPKHSVPVAEVPATAPAHVEPINNKSIAVLPFVDMSEKKDQEYFSDGLSEELIDQLTHSPDLKVIARTSSFQFKGKNEDMRTIGQKLGVANLLEGSVRTSGKTLRVTAQLIKVTDGSHLWSETYDRNMGDIFTIQDSIAAAVATALKATMATQTSSSQYKSNNLEAYAAFLRGRFFLNKATKDDTDHALAAFEESARLDPSYAAAWAGIADTYNSYGIGNWMPPMKAYAEAKKAVDHALSLDPNLAYAHRQLGTIQSNYLYDEAGSKAEYERARQLDPTDGSLIIAEAWDTLGAGRFDESIRLFRLGTQGDPLNSNGLYGLAYALFDADRQPEAESAVHRLLEVNPNASGSHCLLGWILLAQHKSEAALATMSEESDPTVRWCEADALWALGRRAEADALLAEAKGKFTDTQAYSLAGSYAWRNDKDEAFKWLNRAYENHEAIVPGMKVELHFKNLRGDPRFTELLHKINIPE